MTLPELRRRIREIQSGTDETKVFRAIVDLLKAEWDYLLPMAAQMNISPDELKQVLRVRGFA